VKPTPAVGGESAEDGSSDPAAHDWCRELSEATAGGQAVLEIYEQGTSLADSAIPDATAVLTPSNPSDEKVDRAAADVEAACQAAGVEIENERGQETSYSACRCRRQPLDEGDRGQPDERRTRQRISVAPTPGR
jgi:hypothetical protein